MLVDIGCALNWSSKGTTVYYARPTTAFETLGYRGGTISPSNSSAPQNVRNIIIPWTSYNRYRAKCDEKLDDWQATGAVIKDKCTFWGSQASRIAIFRWQCWGSTPSPDHRADETTALLHPFSKSVYSLRSLGQYKALSWWFVEEFFGLLILPVYSIKMCKRKTGRGLH